MIADKIRELFVCLGVAAIVQHHYGRFIPPRATIEAVSYIGNGVLNVRWSRV